MITTGILMGVGDSVAQRFFNHEDENGNRPPYDPLRTMRAWCYGSFIFSPLAVFWYGKTLPFIKNPFVSAIKREAWSGKRIEAFDIGFRIGIDQLILPGLVWIPLYNASMTLLAFREDPFNVIKEKLEKNWWNVLKTSWSVWPIFQLISFTVIPIHLRVFASNICSIGWNCFLSTVHNAKHHYKNKFLETVHELDESNVNFS